MAERQHSGRIPAFVILLLLAVSAFTVELTLSAPASDTAASSGPQWEPGHYFPTFPPTNQVYAINVTAPLQPSDPSWNPSFRINDSTDLMMALTLVGMQGIINRDGPKVYLNWISKCDENASGFWLRLLRQQVNVVNEENLTDLEAIQFLYEHYGSDFAGAVVYDPSVPDTINVATMIAGLENRTILAPEQLGAPGMPQFSSVLDLRQLVASQDWNNTEAGVDKLYLWVYDNLWPQLEHRMIAISSPGPPTSGAFGEPTMPLDLAARDYFVALRLPVLWLSPTVDPQASLLKRFLGSAPSPIPILGVYGSQEIDSVSLFSRYGDTESGIGWDNSPLVCGDLTVLSGVRPPIQTYQPSINPDNLFATLGNKHVMTIWSSDGDSFEFQLDRGYHGLENFVWEAVQGQNFGWSIDPMLAEVAPIAWNYYVESARNVTLLNAISGAGYAFPALMNASQLDAYLVRSGLYMNETGLRSIWALDGYLYPLLWDKQLSDAYYSVLRNSGLLGIYACEGCAPTPGLDFAYYGVPAPVAFADYGLNSTNGPWIINKILSRQPGTDLMDLGQPGSGGYVGRLVADSLAYGGQSLLFSHNATTCCLVVQTPSEELPPGNYTVSYSLKMPDNTSALQVGQLYAGIELAGGGWNTMASRYISPSEFTSTSRYQNFTISFTLKNLTSDIQFRIDYYGGQNHPGGSWASADLYADTITSNRQGGFDLPIFNGIFVSLVQHPIQQLNEAPSIGEDFDRAGGLTLTPDEYLAALNPQFMIQWATPILGADNSGLVTAKAQLASGDFIDSLLTVRNALRNLPTRNYTSDVSLRGYEYPVTVGANSWITNIGLNQTANELSFLTHGPPGRSAHIVITLPDGLLFGPLSVEVDGKPQAVMPVKSVGVTTVTFDISQGPHRVVVMVGTPPTTVTTTTAAATSSTTLTSTMTATAVTATTLLTTTMTPPTVIQTSASTLTIIRTTEISAPVGLTPYLLAAGAVILAGGLVGYGLLRRRRG